MMLTDGPLTWVWAAAGPAEPLLFVLALLAHPAAARTAMQPAVASMILFLRMVELLERWWGVTGASKAQLSGPESCGGRQRRRRFSRAVISPSAISATIAMMTMAAHPP